MAETCHDPSFDGNVSVGRKTPYIGGVKKVETGCYLISASRALALVTFWWWGNTYLKQNTGSPRKL